MRKVVIHGIQQAARDISACPEGWHYSVWCEIRNLAEVEVWTGQMLTLNSWEEHRSNPEYRCLDERMHWARAEKGALSPTQQIRAAVDSLMAAVIRCSKMEVRIEAEGVAKAFSASDLLDFRSWNAIMDARNVSDWLRVSVDGDPVLELDAGLRGKTDEEISGLVDQVRTACTVRRSDIMDCRQWC